MNILIDNILDWAEKRNLLHPSNAPKQCLKMMSEMGELYLAVDQDDEASPDVKDGIGDTMVTMIILSSQLGICFKEEVLNYTPKVGVHYFILPSLLGEICDSVAKDEYERNEMVKTMQNSVAILESIAKSFRLKLDECLDFAYNEIKNRKGKTVNGTFIKD